MIPACMFTYENHLSTRPKVGNAHIRTVGVALL